MSQRYKIRTPTIALDGGKLIHLPAETAVTTPRGFSNREIFTEVVWDGRALKMFTRDLIERAEEITE
jgi:hypothetical protein